MMNREGVLCYTAGIIDGEGSICINKTMPKGGRKTPAYGLSVKVTNTDPKMLVMLRDSFGGDIYKEKRGMGKQIYNWRILGRRAERFLVEVEPYLLCKGKQARIGISFYGTFKDLINEGRYQLTSPEVVEIREKHFLMLQKELHMRPTLEEAEKMFREREVNNAQTE